MQWHTHVTHAHAYSRPLPACPPSPPPQVRGWTLRQVTPLALNVQRVPYPIPPAGADPATWASEEEPPPLGVTAPLPPDVVLLEVRRLCVCVCVCVGGACVCVGGVHS